MVCDGASPTLRNCSFLNNSKNGDGGALRCLNNSRPVVSHNRFENNSATGSGGAVYLYNQSFAALDHNLFANNAAGANGGAIAGVTQNAGLFTPNYNTFYNNSAGGNGGALGHHDDGGRRTIDFLDERSLGSRQPGLVLRRSDNH